MKKKKLIALFLMLTVCSARQAFSMEPDAERRPIHRFVLGSVGIVSNPKGKKADAAIASELFGYEYISRSGTSISIMPINL